LSMPEAQPLPPPATAPQVAFQFASRRDDVEREPIKERFTEMMRAVQETSRLSPPTLPSGRAPHLQDQSKRFTVDVVAGRKPTH
jgi:hypothetical protein